MSDAAYSPDDPAQVKDRKSRAQRARARALDDLAILMGDARFRRFLWTLLSRCRIYQTSFHADALQMAFNEGQRQIGLTLLADVHAGGMEDYLRMMDEARQGDVT